MNRLNRITLGFFALLVILAGIACDSDAPTKTSDTNKTNTASPTGLISTRNSKLC